MAYVPVTWANRDPVTAVKLQQMADNESYLKTQVDQKMPYGIIGGAKRVTQITGLTGGTTTLLSGLAVTVTVPAARVLRVEFFVRGWASDQPGVTIGQQIFRDGALINERNVFIPIGSNGQGGGSTKVIDLLAAGTYTYQAGVQILTYPAAAPSITMSADSARYNFLVVEDIGSTTGISIPEN